MKTTALALLTAFAAAACAPQSEESIAASYDAISAYASAPKVAGRVAQANLEADPTLLPAMPATGTYSGQTTLGDRLFLADFTNGRIDVLDASSTPITVPGGFVDPTLPVSYAPYNVQALAGKLYVAFGTTDALGGGIVDTFDADGRFLRRVAQGGSLDAPWGLALAPAAFGPLGGALLVGNSGSGRIVAFDPRTGAELGPLADLAGQPIVLESLMAIASVGDDIYFAAGGRFGRLAP